jgi:DNA-binding NarL/FixJ family response regulator
MKICRVILIEDSPQDRAILRRLLDYSQDIRCDIVEADRLNAGKGEIYRAIEQPEDVIVILDLGLLDGTGMRLQAVAEIREISNNLTLYVLTGAISTVEIITAIEMGADGVWQKPPEAATFVGLLLQAQALRKREIAHSKTAEAALTDALAQRDKQYVEQISKLQPRVTPTWYKRASVWKVIFITLATMLTAVAALVAAMRH